MKKTFTAKDLDIKITAKTSTLLSNSRYKYITNDIAFTYQVDDEHLIGNYQGIRSYLNEISKNEESDLKADAEELLKTLKRITRSNEFELFEIYYDAMGGESLRGLDV